MTHRLFRLPGSRSDDLTVNRSADGAWGNLPALFLVAAKPTQRLCAVTGNQSGRACAGSAHPYVMYPTDRPVQRTAQALIPHPSSLIPRFPPISATAIASTTRATGIMSSPSPGCSAWLAGTIARLNPSLAASFSRSSICETGRT